MALKKKKKKEKKKKKKKKENFFLFFLLSQGDSWAMMTIREMKAGVMPAQPCSLAPVCPDTHGHVTAFLFLFDFNFRYPRALSGA